MGAGAFIEPLVVITLLLGGAFLTRNTTYTLFPRSQTPLSSAEKGLLSRNGSLDSIDADMAELGLLSETSISSRLLPAPEPTWRKRTVGVLCWKTQVTSLNTRVFREYFLSRVLIKFPFLVEAWYWALVYWVSASLFHIAILSMTGHLTNTSIPGLPTQPCLYRRHHGLKHCQHRPHSRPSSHCSGAASTYFS